ncbi:MAG: hypothetical protein LBQ66_08830 [Planctomycetaceae bacterium]|jgi:hypothetical protein|nr:hypothetical protein [Planctomycetaceae bacterium]
MYGITRGNALIDRVMLFLRFITIIFLIFCQQFFLSWFGIDCFAQTNIAQTGSVTNPRASANSQQPATQTSPATPTISTASVLPTQPHPQPTFKILHTEKNATILEHNRTPLKSTQPQPQPQTVNPNPSDVKLPAVKLPAVELSGVGVGVGGVEFVENLVVELPDKSSVSLGSSIGFPVMIDELNPSVMVRANGGGITIAAQIVLPYSIHPQTKKPVTFIVAGSNYSGSGTWEQLEFCDRNGQPDLWQRVEKMTIPLRAELNYLDLREKYVRQIILFIEPIPNQPARKTINIKKPFVTGILPVREEFQNLYEKQSGGELIGLFDPINFEGFKLVAGSQCEFVGSHVVKLDGVEKRWDIDPNKLASVPLVPRPLSINSPSPNLSPNHSPNPSLTSPLLSRVIANNQPQSPPQHDTSSLNRNSNPATNPATNPPSSDLLRNDKLPVKNPRTLYGNDQTDGSTNFILLQDRAATDYTNFVPSNTNIQISDKILLVDNSPVGVRAVEYQGEPLEFLRKLEFNAVWVKERPSVALLQEAREAGVWLICKPPSPNEIVDSKPLAGISPDVMPPNVSGSISNIPISNSIFDYVLVWNIGDDCTQPRHQEDTNRATLLQSADRLRHRPLLCTARSGVWEYSRIVDILLMENKPLLSSLDFNELAIWQKNYQALARPDTPFWSTIQTDADPKLANQWILFGGNTQEICPITHEQIKMQVYQAIASGVHGFIFTSNSPLTNNDPATEYRRASLELMNWELQLIEDWFAGGREQPAIVQSTQRGNMAMAVLQSGRTRLLVPIWQERYSQFAVSGAFEGNVKYVIPGIPETYGAFLLVPNRMFPLPTRRVAGGTEVILEEAGLNSLIYFGEIDSMYARVGERAKIIGQRCAYLACHLAELQLASTRQVLDILKQAKESNAIPIHPKDNLPLITMREQESQINMTKQAIEIAKSFIVQSPPAYGMAYLQAERSTRGLRVVARDILREGTRHDSNPCMTPVSVSFATMPYYLTTFQRTMGAVLGQNRLLSGDMENVVFWQQSGWISQRHKIEGISDLLSISPQASRTGAGGLRIVTQADNGESKPKQIETAPIWVISPPIQINMGELICVNGWIRIPNLIESGVDGLTIFDSLGGESLAIRFKETKGQWREFAFYRYAPTNTNYYVYFALNGIGEVHIDDVRIASVQFEQPKPIIPEIRPSSPTLPRFPIDRLNPLQYLPTFPRPKQTQ